jgi:PAS domain S-box-containing protein
MGDGIIERELIEKALQESEKKYRLLIDTANESVIVAQDGLFRFVNPMTLRLLGVDSEQELIDRPFPEFIHPDDRSMVVENYRRRIANEALPPRYDFRFVARDGTVKWVEINATLIEWQGKPATLNFLTDITKHKRVEEALEESRARNELAIQSAQMGSWVLDTVENKRDFDAQTCHLLGIDHATFKGSPDEFFRVVHPNDRSAVRAALTRSIERDAHYESAYRAILPDGSIRHIVARGRVIRDQNRRPLKLIGIIWDDTERKQVEETLLASHQILNGIINAIPVRVFWKDKDLVYLGCNAIFAQDAGFADPKDVVGKDDYQMGWRDQAELYRADDRQVIENGRPKLLIEEPQTTPDGNTIVLLTSKIPLRSSEGEIIGVLGTYMDITERKRMESELRRSRDELELRVKERTQELTRKNTEMERFIYTVSHDLRTPLISVSGLLGFIKEDSEKGDLDLMRADLRIANEAVTKMDRLLLETLELSRIGRVVSPLEDVPFVEIVEDALRQTSEKIRSKGFKVSIAQNLPVVHVDRMRITEVLVNLIENSIKYMGLQTDPEIEIGQRIDGMDRIFFVRDNGIGIDPSQHDKVFELFYKVNNGGEGTGAGLAIVKRIIEVHGGRIWIESELGKGCTVCFTLPLANVR